MDRRKENVPVLFDRRHRSDRVIYWAVDRFLKKATAAHQFKTVPREDGGAYAYTQ